MAQDDPPYWRGIHPARRAKSRVFLLVLPELADDDPLALRSGDGLALIVEAAALRKHALPRPAARYVHARLTRHPNRRLGDLVDLDALARELHQVGLSWADLHVDPREIVDGLTALCRTGKVAHLRVACTGMLQGKDRLTEYFLLMPLWLHPPAGRRPPQVREFDQLRPALNALTPTSRH